MGLTKSVAEIDAWAQVAVGAIRKGAEIDLSAVYENIITVVVAHDSVNAHTNGALVTLQTRAGLSDDFWRVEQEVRTPGGTAAKVDVDADSGAGEPNPERLNVVSTTNFEQMNDTYFVKNGTIAASGIVRNNGFVNDDYIICLDDITTIYDFADDVFNIVTEYRFFVPPGASTARVLIWNDDADCTIVTRTDLEKQTGI